MTARFCKDCLHRVIVRPKIEATDIERDECKHPSAFIPPETDMVTGEIEPARQMTCRSNRWSVSQGRCGEDGTFWEPKEQ